MFVSVCKRIKIVRYFSAVALRATAERKRKEDSDQNGYTALA